MKGQDIFFFILLIITLVVHNRKLAVFLGLFFLALSIPLFSFWVFFTAERFVWYAVGFFCVGIILFFFEQRK